MADLASAQLKLNNIEVSSDAPLSEALMAKIGASNNGLIDDAASQDARIAALENEVMGRVYQGGNSTPGATLLSLTVALGANDYVAAVLGASGVGSAGLVITPSFQQSGGFNFVRNGEVLSTAQATSSAATITPKTVVDKPGAGTFTYSFVGAGGTSFNINGSLELRVIRG